MFYNLIVLPTTSGGTPARAGCMGWRQWSGTKIGEAWILGQTSEDGWRDKWFCLSFSSSFMCFGVPYPIVYVITLVLIQLLMVN